MSEFVTIACSFPNGVVLRDFKGKTAFTANGDKSGTLKTTVAGSHTLTPGCRLSTWQSWSKMHRNEPIITGRYVYAIDPATGEEVSPG